MDNNKHVPRPVRPSDFAVIFMGLIHNIAQITEAFTSELFELSIYHANNRIKTEIAIEDMTLDLETLRETDG